MPPTRRPSTRPGWRAWGRTARGSMHVCTRECAWDVLAPTRASKRQAAAPTAALVQYCTMCTALTSPGRQTRSCLRAACAGSRRSPGRLQGQPLCNRHWQWQPSSGSRFGHPPLLPLSNLEKISCRGACRRKLWRRQQLRPLQGTARLKHMRTSNFCGTNRPSGSYTCNTMAWARSQQQWGH